MKEHIMLMRTPNYVINSEKFLNNLVLFKEEFANFWKGEIIFGYSIKTNNNAALLKLAKKNDMYAEVVSDDEYKTAQNIGFDKNSIIFNGPQKSEQVLLDAIVNNSIVNLDNFEEIQAIERNIDIICSSRIKIGLRVNFDLESECPQETTAGDQVSRFGFCIENGDLYKAIQKLEHLGIRVNGLHMHYSTKSRSLKVFKALSEKAANIIKQTHLMDQIKFIDIGGGFFLGDKANSKGKPRLKDYARVISTPLLNVIDPNKVTLILEPGASLLSTSVDYYTKVINERIIRNTKILTVDGSILHINPFMYFRKIDFEIECNVDSIIKKTCAQKQVICGSTCMENDRFLSLDINTTELSVGDVLICHNVGAYTMVFNNSFINTPPYIYLKEGSEFTLIRKK